MKRRTFVQNLLAAGVFSGISGQIQLPQNPHDTAALYTPEILHLFDDPTEVVEIGNTYLALNPTHADEQVLVEHMKGRFFDQHPSGKTLADQVKKDFTDGDIIQLKGWILSQTEAQQCALYSLTHS